MTIINLTADNIRKAKARRFIACPIVTVLIIATMATPAFAESLKDKSLAPGFTFPALPSGPMAAVCRAHNCREQ